LWTTRLKSRRHIKTIMFSQFFYFIIVILIYSTYQPSNKANFSLPETLILFFFFLIIFIGSTGFRFSKLEKRINENRLPFLDQKFNAIVRDQTILAIILFAVNIYVLNIMDFLLEFGIFSIIPTFLAILCVALFLFYLCVIWKFSHRLYQLIYHNHVSGPEYMMSNISFALPVILPWLVLTITADILILLPFEYVKRFMASSQGEIAYFLFFLFVAAIIGPAVIQKLWRCKPVEAGYERYRIEALCKTAGLEFSDILYWPMFGGKMLTAGIMGLIKKFRYILVTRSLLEMLTPEEIDAVIAHEIGHIKKRHLIFYLLFFMGYLLLSYAAVHLFLYVFIYAQSTLDIFQRSELNSAAMTSVIFNTALIISFIIYFRFVFGFFMRNFERQADAYVFQLFKSARPLITTLEKIAISSGLPPEKPNWHHFSIKERISFLSKCETNKAWIARHERKIKTGLIIYLAGLMVIGGIELNLNFGKAGEKLDTVFFEKILIKELEKTPNNPALYGALGDLYYGNSHYKKALFAYEKSLDCLPDNPQILNNVAWLLATCPNPNLRNPERALELAQKAITLKVTSHILDTLAESYYVNGRYREAVLIELRAIDLVKENRSYYEKQLKKFEAKKEKGQLLDPGQPTLASPF